MMEPSSASHIAIEQAGAGMVLAADLRDSHGAVLLPQGAILTDATLASLRRRGVAQCTVVRATDGLDGDDENDKGGDGSAAASAARAAARAAQLARLQHLFRHTATHEANATLLQLLTDYRNRE
ncbi:hypothetical protein H3H37_03050 [Duganella sp. LX20W]|uniref:Uncharacterized protein n=1 Tax=Rugamonas brunnea TaxID=2758569 RepID=A0A7W2IA51_9BURK|nr:hypothetical protein [Rugamonas brunnea]MBA5636026.1 hypothetical protein [Rugamonas brunnea]